MKIDLISEFFDTTSINNDIRYQIVKSIGYTFSLGWLKEQGGPVGFTYLSPDGAPSNDVFESGNQMIEAMWLPLLGIRISVGRSVPAFP